MEANMDHIANALSGGNGLKNKTTHVLNGRCSGSAFNSHGEAEFKINTETALNGEKISTNINESRSPEIKQKTEVSKDTQRVFKEQTATQQTQKVVRQIDEEVSEDSVPDNTTTDIENENADRRHSPDLVRMKTNADTDEQKERAKENETISLNSTENGPEKIMDTCLPEDNKQENATTHETQILNEQSEAFECDENVSETPKKVCENKDYSKVDIKSKIEKAVHEVDDKEALKSEDMPKKTHFVTPGESATSCEDVKIRSSDNYNHVPQDKVTHDETMEEEKSGEVVKVAPVMDESSCRCNDDKLLEEQSKDIKTEINKTPNGPTAESASGSAKDTRKRKVSADDREKLAHHKLDSHACLLWASENRRSVVLSNCEASHGKVEKILQDRWQQLTEREKSKYFQRARRALQERTCVPQLKKRRGSATVARGQGSVDKPDHAISDTGAATLSANAPTRPAHSDPFYNMESDDQYRILQSKLGTLGKYLTRNEYERFIDNFKTSFKLTKRSLEKQRDVQLTRKYLEAVSRRLLYVKCRLMDDNLDALTTRKTKAETRTLNIKFKMLLGMLVNGDDVPFSDLVESESVDGALNRMKTMEDQASNEFSSGIRMSFPQRGMTLDASSNATDMTATDSYRRIIKDFQSIEKSQNYSIKINGRVYEVPRITHEKNEREILINASTTESIPDLDVNELCAYFKAIEDGAIEHTQLTNFDLSNSFLNRSKDNFYRSRHGIGACCQMESPSCFLTNLLVADKISQGKLGEIIK
ncbi:unnamed protein product [Owenia fusiformis]|uniref:Uncharacterized protein n=1 Tax=Owenia fusiformis TaxID=6347 RepID=A0A8J1UVL1_OWEFU|nr:unnamed protein product [Owenia fusiformis]